MLVGCHALVWTGEFDGDGVEIAVRNTKAAGFDLIEFPLMDPTTFNVAGARAAVDAAEIAASASLGLSESCDVSSESAEIVARGAELLHAAVDVAAQIGSPYLCGVIYSAMKKYLAPPTPRGIANSAAVLREVADHAAGLGIAIGLEVVNRYETNILNTASQALRYLDLVARPNVVVHLDSYHMNIEESGLGDPVDACGKRLGYVHIGENHRGYLGSGSADLASLFRALDRNGYDGPLVFEAFSSAVVSPTLSNALGIWREVWSDGHDLGQHAAKVMRDLAVAAQHANAQARSTGELILASG